jgi:hypothetical protein
VMGSCTIWCVDCIMVNHTWLPVICDRLKLAVHHSTCSGTWRRRIWCVLGYTALHTSAAAPLRPYSGKHSRGGSKPASAISACCCAIYTIRCSYARPLHAAAAVLSCSCHSPRSGSWR